ncbi:type IV pilus biogenesis/stability protein PilW [Xenophilus sp.]|uniref:type IV pilus biogenesis/stability protein PilW n=1 Tax=Xenophilus sp. TaxID=1873499 RepID=UPI0037DC307E
MTSPFPPVAARGVRRLWCTVALLALAAGCTTTTTTTTTLADTRHAGPPVAEPADAANMQRRAELRMQLALGYFQQGQPEVALGEVNQALAADPNLAAAYNLRGLIHMRLDEPEKAEDSFRRAIALKPRDADARHNYGWLLCQQKRYADASREFAAALAVPTYQEASKTLMTQGVCQMQAGDRAGAEKTLMQAYEMDAGNPVIGYNLALLLYQRGDFARTQFYVRRINNGPTANAESLWLGIRTERRLGNREAVGQLGTQLQRRFPQSREALAYERGSFDD